MLRYKAALFIGRFQPLHKGHLYSMRKALEVAESIIIGIGSSNEEGTANNPFSEETRRKMIEKVIEREINRQKVIEVIGIPDVPMDEEWGKNVKLIIQKSKLEMRDVVVVSNNEWTNRVLKQAGMKVFEPGLRNRGEWEGYKVREILRKGGGEWRGRVPRSVAQIIEENPLV